MIESVAQTASVDAFRLSPQQVRLWLAGGSGSRAVLIADLQGPLDVQRLRAAVAEVVGRHEILRTGFQEIEGLKMPAQIIRGRVEVAWDENDATDLEEGPTLRCGLVRTGPESHALTVALPALCADSTTLANLFAEVAAAYAGDASEDEALQYADFTEWQHELLESEDTAAGREHWLAHGDWDSAPLRLPWEKPASPAPFAPEVVRVELDPALQARLRAFSEGSLPALVLTAWSLLLGRLTGLAEVTVGTVFDGRKYEGMDVAFGLFARHLPLRCPAGVAFGDAWSAVREAVETAHTWQEYFAREDGSFPFTFEALSLPEDRQADGVAFSVRRIDACLEPFRLGLTLIERGVSFESFELEIRHDAARIHRADAERLGEELTALLAGAIDGELEMVGPIERRRLIEEINATAVELPLEVPLHRWFERKAAEAPASPAILGETGELTYSELNARANRLAHRLIGMGVRTGDLVAICVDRGPDMVAAAMAVLKAGAGYVPLDPVNPRERLRHMLETARPSAVIVGEGQQAALPEGEAPRLVLGPLDGPAHNPGVQVPPEVVAYVIFTSGSTGKPKGVMITHRSIVNRLLWAQSEYPLSPGDRVLQSAAFSFDFSVWEIFGSLISGAAMVLPKAGGQRDSSYLVRLMAEAGVSVAHFVPSMFQLVVEEEGLAACGLLRLVFAGGEALPVALAERFFSRSNAVLYNQYGPTEGTIDATFWRCRSGETGEVVPIGLPIFNSEALVLDRRMRPVPTGAIGDIHLGGVAVALGYVRQPDLTADRFVPHPFSSRPGERLYRTGDVGRQRPDGAVEFLGRSDQQVKVRGFRIELGEIEAVLGGHPDVREVAVAAVSDGYGGNRLVAYVVPSAGREAEVDDLRRFLVERLPEYLVPSAFATLPELPRMPTGKLDRRALPAVEIGAEEETAPSLSGNPVAEWTAEILAQVLGREHVGPDDDFFALGGHSLLAMQAISRLRDAFRIELPLQTLFSRPTPNGLAEEVSAALRSGSGGQGVELAPVPRDREIPLSFPQERLWFLHQLEPGSTAYNVVGGVRLRGALDVEALRRTLREIVRRQEGMRTCFPTVDGRGVQRVLPPEAVELRFEDLSGIPEEGREAEAWRHAADEERLPFRLADEPPCRLRLLRFADDDHVLVMTFHHIAFDGWSGSVLTRELAALYTAFSEGAPSPLPELPIQYADYAGWQRRTLEGETLESLLGYWEDQLAGMPPVLDLPLDRPRPAVRTSRGGRHAFTLPAASAEALRTASRRQGATFYMGLLAAFKATLHGFTGGEDLFVGTDVANRGRSELEGLIGFFVNQLVLRTRLTGDPDFKELVDRVRGMSLGAFAHQDLPFSRLVEHLRPKRDLSHNPLFQVLCVLQNAPGAALRLPGVTLAPLESESEGTAFDLSLHMWESPEGLRCNIKYAAELFEPETVARIGAAFARVVEIAAERPDVRLSELRREVQELELRDKAANAERMREARQNRFKNAGRRAVTS